MLAVEALLKVQSEGGHVCAVLAAEVGVEISGQLLAHSPSRDKLGTRCLRFELELAYRLVCWLGGCPRGTAGETASRCKVTGGVAWCVG